MSAPGKNRTFTGSSALALLTRSGRRLCAAAAAATLASFSGFIGESIGAIYVRLRVFRREKGKLRRLAPRGSQYFAHFHCEPLNCERFGYELYVVIEHSVMHDALRVNPVK
jgi:hypothetical protein